MLATYGYDQLGRRTSLTLGNGEQTLYSYDPAARLQTLTHDLGGTATTNDDVTSPTIPPLALAIDPVSEQCSAAGSLTTGAGRGAVATHADGSRRPALEGAPGVIIRDGRPGTMLMRYVPLALLLSSGACSNSPTLPREEAIRIAGLLAAKECSSEIQWGRPRKAFGLQKVWVVKFQPDPEALGGVCTIIMDARSGEFLGAMAEQ